MSTTIEGIYKKGIIKPLEDVKLENNTKVIITIKNESEKKASLADLAGVWKDRDDIGNRFAEILRERKNFNLKEAR